MDSNFENDSSAAADCQKTSRGYLRFRRTRKALVLEDDRVTCWMIARTLRQSGWEVTVTGAVAEAMKFADDSLEVVFVDINLPDGDGIKFIKHLDKVAPAARVVICTADERTEVAENAKQAGAYEFLQKPLAPKTVMAASRRALGADAKTNS